SPSVSLEQSLGNLEMIIRIKPIYDNDRYDGAILILTNVTDLVHARNQAEEALRFAQLAKQEAERANNSKSSFLANMSHEIRTPMNAIIGFADLIASGEINKEQKEYIEVIRTSALHLLNLINDILDLSKIESGKTELELSETDLKALVKDVVSIAKPNLKPDVKVSLLIDETLPDALYCDNKVLRQVFINLLNNAVKFTTKGKIIVTLSESEELKSVTGYSNILFFVSDTGIGIPEDKLESIFDAFDRGSKSSSRDFEGTGLGLSITKKLVEMMDGKIQVESKPGKGSVFSVHIPLKNAARIEKSVKPQVIDEKEDTVVDDELPLIEKEGDLPGVLLAEDNPVNRKLIGAYLKDFRCSLEFASDGLQAVQMASFEKYNIILMDIQMPKMDGYESTQKIRKIPHHANTPIIALTAHAMKGEKEKAEKAGFSGYITKPVSRVDLIDSLSYFLGYSKSEGKNNITVFRQKKELDPEILELLPMYIENLHIQLADYKEALVVQDFSQIRMIGHSMRGNGSIFGYNEISAIGAQVENAALSEDLPLLEKLFDQFEKAL
ncbi:MAG: ATP-binding protein, partial [Firmicutes bacterium]|nr:ATP-binding protein [Bacillota bacterium]